MKENFEAYFRLSIKEIEIAGPVDYVKEQITANSGVIDLFLDKIKSDKVRPLLPPAMINVVTPPQGSMEVSETKYTDFEEVAAAEDIFRKYANIIDKNGEKIQILSKIPGESLAQRMVNLILIYLYIKLKSNIDVVSFDELRQTCEIHGELDKGHFSVYIKTNKKFFVVDGTGKGARVKITIPGMKEAEKLLDTLNNKN